MLLNIDNIQSGPPMDLTQCNSPNLEALVAVGNGTEDWV